MLPFLIFKNYNMAKCSLAFCFGALASGVGAAPTHAAPAAAIYCASAGLPVGCVG